MNFVRIDTNGFPSFYTKLPSIWKNVSDFPNLSATEQLTYGFYPVVKIQPAFDSRYQYQSGPVVTVDSGMATATWTNHEKDLVTVKYHLIANLRQQTHDFIMGRYPDYVQHNRNVPGRLTAEEITDMDTKIDIYREVYHTAKTAVNAAISGAEAVGAAILAWPEEWPAI